MEINRLATKIAGIQIQAKFGGAEVNRTQVNPFAAAYPKQQKQDQEAVVLSIKDSLIKSEKSIELKEVYKNVSTENKTPPAKNGGLVALFKVYKDTLNEMNKINKKLKDKDLTPEERAYLSNELVEANEYFDKLKEKAKAISDKILGKNGDPMSTPVETDSRVRQAALALRAISRLETNIGLENIGENGAEVVFSYDTLGDETDSLMSALGLDSKNSLINISKISSEFDKIWESLKSYVQESGELQDPEEVEVQSLIDQNKISTENNIKKHPYDLLNIGVERRIGLELIVKA